MEQLWSQHTAELLPLGILFCRMEPGCWWSSFLPSFFSYSMGNLGGKVNFSQCAASQELQHKISCYFWLKHRAKRHNHAQTWRVKWGPAALPIRLVIPLYDPPPLYPSLHNLLPLNNSLNHPNHSNFRAQQAELSHITPPSGVSFCRRSCWDGKRDVQTEQAKETSGRNKDRARSIRGVRKTWIWGNTSSRHRHKHSSCVGPVRKGAGGGGKEGGRWKLGKLERDFLTKS